MAYQKHPRHITDEQFSDGTTIDGSRIDNAMEDVVGHVNSIPKGDLGRRFVQSQYVAGWQPWSAATGAATTWDAHHMPWLPTINFPTGDPALPATAIFPGSVVGSQPDEIKNRHRFKGIEVPGISYGITDSTATDYDELAITGIQWAWSRSFHFSSPAIVHDIAVHLHADNTASADEPYRNPFLYHNATSPGPAPPGFEPSDGSHDLCVLLDVAHPFTPEDTRMRSVVVLRRGFNAADSAISRLPMGALSTSSPAYVDFHPTFRGGVNNDNTETVGGIFVRMHDLNIPLPAGSRVRLAVVIPQYQKDAVDSSWGDYSAAVADKLYLRPWSTQSYSATLTVLEEVISV